MDEQVGAHAAHLGGGAARSRAPTRSARAPVQGASMPVIAGVMGPKAIARAAHWADGVDGAWTMDGDLDAHDAVVRPDPRVVGRRRPHRGAPPLVEHLVRARRRRRSAPARVRVRLHEGHGRRCRRLGGGRGHVLHARRVAPRGRPRARGGRRRVLPRARPPRIPTSWLARATRSASDRGGRRRPARGGRAPRSASTTTATRPSATGWTRCGRRPPRRPTSTRSGCSRSRPRCGATSRTGCACTSGTAPIPRWPPPRSRRRSSSWACPAAAPPR